MEEHYEEIAASYDELYSELAEGYKSRFPIFCSVYDKYFPEPPKSILDLGGGSGMMVPYLKEAFGTKDVTVSDFSENMLKVCAEKGYGTFFSDMNKPATLEKYAEDGGRKFDLVFSMGCLHHCDDLANLFKAVAEYLVEDKGAIIAILEHDCKFPCPQRLYDRRSEVYAKLRLAMDKACESSAGLKLLHKELFKTPDPWTIPCKEYKKMIDGQFLTQLRDATQDELKKFDSEVLSKESVVFENKDWIYLLKKN